MTFKKPFYLLLFLFTVRSVIAQDSLGQKSDFSQQALQQKNLFNSLYNAADSAIADSDFNAALINYQKALDISLPDTSENYYIRQQINYLQKAIPLREAHDKQVKEEEEHSKSVDHALALYNQAQDSVKLGNFNFALTYFKQFIDYVDSTHLTSDEYDFEKLLNYARKKVSQIQDYIDTKNAKKEEPH